MGLLAWILGFFKSLFGFKTREKEWTRTEKRKVEKSLEAERRKKLEKLEDRNFSQLHNSAVRVFNYLKNYPEARNYEKELYNFMQKLKEVRDSPGVNFKARHLKELKALWSELYKRLPNIRSSLHKSNLRDVQRRLGNLAK